MIDKIVDIYHGDSVPREDFKAAVAGGVVAIIHKSSQGIGYRDPKYAPRRVKAAAAGLLWGAYHFATGSSGVDQADHFLDAAKPDDHTLMALDLERNESGTTVKLRQAEDFVRRVFEKTKRYPFAYGSDIVAELAAQIAQSGKDSVLLKCPLWIARYGPTPKLPPGWKKWTMWQYQTGEGKSDPLPGLGHVDRNRFDGTLDDLKKVWAA